jgi:hypothetical protein
MITPEPETDIDIKILEGQKATLMIVNGMGFPICRHITVQKADIVPARRYQGHMTDKKCLQLQYVEKGKRKPVGTRYTEANLAVVSKCSRGLWNVFPLKAAATKQANHYKIELR